MTGSFITIHSVISPYLLKCSWSPSAQQNTNLDIRFKWQLTSGTYINFLLSLYYCLHTARQYGTLFKKKITKKFRYTDLLNKSLLPLTDPSSVINWWLMMVTSFSILTVHLTTPLSGIACHQWASTWYFQPTYQIWISISTHYEDMKGDAKCRKWGGLG